MMRTLALTHSFLALLVLGSTGASAQMSTPKSEGVDSTTTSPDTAGTGQKAPVSGARSDSSTSPGAKESTVNRMNVDPPNKTGAKPDGK